MKKLAIYIIGLFILSSATAYAIGAAPLRVQIQGAPGETLETMVRAQNNQEDQKIVVLTKGDFYVNEDESLQFMNEYDENNKYSMQNWIEFIENNIPIEGNNVREIPYKINIPEDAQSGGYYGTVFVGSRNPNAEDATGVGIQTVVAQLILVEVTGDLKTKIELQDFLINKENQIETVVFNKGNTHDSAKGKIILTNRKLDILEEMTINDGQSNSLPNRQKTHATQWDRSNYEPGIYYAYLDASTEKDNIIASELKFEINRDSSLKHLKLTKGKTYEIAKNLYNDFPIIPIVIVGFELLVALLYFIFKFFRKS